MRITRRMEFSATHRLWRRDWDERRNRETFGARADRRQYGHNYVLEVTLRGPVDPVSGMVMDLKALKRVLADEVEARFDHRNLNEDLDCFRARPPTAENLASVLFGVLDRALPEGLLDRVRLAPTEDLFVEVTR